MQHQTPGGHPTMSDVTTDAATEQKPADANPEATEPATEDSKSLPPWGDDFNPEIAWERLQKVQRENKDLRQRTSLTPEQQKKLDEYEALEEASKSEAQRKDEAAAKAERERDEAVAEATRLKIALRHGISEDDFDLLGSGTEEQIEARAKKISEKNEAAKQAALESQVTTPTSPSPRRPAAQLQPGASPSPDPAQDDSYYPEAWLSPSQRARLEKARGVSS